jgi:hypothetical protein
MIMYATQSENTQRDRESDGVQDRKGERERERERNIAPKSTPCVRSTLPDYSCRVDRSNHLWDLAWHVRRLFFVFVSENQIMSLARPSHFKTQS